MPGQLETRRPRAPRLPAAQRREQVLDAALQLAAGDGLGAISMEAVARGVGVAKTVVYDAFSGREELIAALLQRERALAIADLAAVFPSTLDGADPDELLQSAQDRFLAAVHANPARWRLILMPPEGTPEAVREAVEAGREALVRSAQPLIEWGIERRGGPHLDPELTTRTILVAAENMARLVLADPQRYPLQRMRTFAATLLAALQASARDDD